MALRIARWPSGKKDEEPGTLDERPGTKKSRREARKRAIQAKWPAGKPKNRPGNQNRRPDDEIPGRDGKKPPGFLKRRPGMKKGVGELQARCGSPTSRFFDKRSPSGGRYGRPSSWRWCI